MMLNEQQTLYGTDEYELLAVEIAKALETELPAISKAFPRFGRGAAIVAIDAIRKQTR